MLWSLNPNITFLNHGSFGACPKPILNKQSEFRELLENEPVSFIIRNLDGWLLQSREQLSKFVHCKTKDLALVPNVTYAVNSILKSYPFKEGDEVLITNHIYNACRVALNYVAKQKNLKIKEIEIDFPGTTPAMVFERVLSGVSDKTRLVMIDHITSPTALLFPVNTIVKELNIRNIDCLIDGAHAPGAIPINVEELGAAYYTGNCHKWMCAPKGVGFLYVREDKQPDIQPLVHSHFSGPERNFCDRFHWSGTGDPTAALCLPEILTFFSTLLPGGWMEMMESNHQKILEARKLLCEAWEIPLPCPDDMLSTMAAIPFGISSGTLSSGYNDVDTLQEYLFSQHHIEIPVFTWPDTSKRIIRPSAQIYNDLSQYQKLANAVMAYSIS